MQDDNIQRRNRFLSNNRWTGLLFLLIGGVLLLRQTGFPLPHWLFTWEMIVITVGLFIGVRHGFKDFSWLIMVLVGFVFLSDDIWPGIQLRQYAVPIIIIALGLLFILSPRRMCGGRGRFRKHSCHRRRDQQFREHPLSGEKGFGGQQPPFESAATSVTDADNTNETMIDVVSIFAGIKKRVLSKQFAGGDIVCVFGGAEVNLTNADFVSPVELDLTMVFGGTKLIVPSNWEVRSEVAAIFGGVDDKRPHPSGGVPEKIVVLKGTLMFGGVEINSFAA